MLAGYLVFGTVSGILMALFLDNVGGACGLVGSRREAVLAYDARTGEKLRDMEGKAGRAPWRGGEASFVDLRFSFVEVSVRD